jgi:regulator of RNase E activity RraA
MRSCQSLLAVTLLLLAAAPGLAQPAAPAAPKGFRSTRTTYSAVMDVLAASRPRVTDEQLAKLKTLPIEAVWGAVQSKGYRHSFVNQWVMTRPDERLVGRALTMRYMPVRPDLMEAVQTLAKEGDWDYQYNVRAGEETKPGDVIVVELGGAIERATFMGDVTGLGIKARGAAGVVVDGGIRDYAEFLPMKGFPVYVKGVHASAMADHVGVEWNAPVRISNVTVLPGDVVVADPEGVLFFPPQIAADVIAAAQNTVYTETFKREMIQNPKYKSRDVYPRLSPELEKLYEEWKKKHPKP